MNNKRNLKCNVKKTCEYIIGYRIVKNCFAAYA